MMATPNARFSARHTVHSPANSSRAKAAFFARRGDRPMRSASPPAMTEEAANSPRRNRMLTVGLEISGETVIDERHELHHHPSREVQTRLGRPAAARDIFGRSRQGLEARSVEPAGGAQHGLRIGDQQDAAGWAGT